MKKGASEIAQAQIWLRQYFHERAGGDRSNPDNGRKYPAPLRQLRERYAEVRD
jgi:hypothetical protein